MGRLILNHARVLDSDHPAVADGVVVIDGDRIAAVGPVAPQADPGDVVVDLAGRTVMPGMVTCHFHSTYHELGSSVAPYGNEYPPAYQALISARNLATALRWGYTGVVGAGGANDVEPGVRRAIDDGLITEAHSISAGLDYPGIGPEHAFLHDVGRVTYLTATDREALKAFQLCCQLEGIIPALEPAHALAKVITLAPQKPRDHLMVVNLCGRGDKDIFTVAEHLGGSL